jgi:glycosyltransferase involved in cell wall biosynthesis
VQPTVLHILPHRGGGAEQYLDALAALPYAQRRVALSSSRAPLLAAPSLAARWPAAALAARRADLVHVHGDMAAILSLPMLRMRPALFTTHGLHLLRRARGARGRLARRGVVAAAAACRATVCTSNAERDELAALLPAPLAARLIAIPNTAPPAPPAPERAAVRAQLGLDDGRVAALFLGELETRKDPLVAVRAANAAVDGGSPLVLLVAGGGPLLEAARALAGPAVRILGHRDDPRALLAAADILVMPSRREGQSIAVLEAMRDGRAVIVSDGPGNPELVGDAGVVVASGDVPALAAALARLAADPDERARLGAAAQRRYEEGFSLERFQERMAALYRETLASP